MDMEGLARCTWRGSEWQNVEILGARYKLGSASYVPSSSVLAASTCRAESSLEVRYSTSSLEAALVSTLLIHSRPVGVLLLWCMLKRRGSECYSEYIEQN